MLPVSTPPASRVAAIPPCCQAPQQQSDTPKQKFNHTGQAHKQDTQDKTELQLASCKEGTPAKQEVVIQVTDGPTGPADAGAGRGDPPDRCVRAKLIAGLVGDLLDDNDSQFD